MECTVPFSLLEPHHCELTGSTFNSEPVSSVKPPSSSTSTPTTSKRQRKEEKKQKEREKRARRDNLDDDLETTTKAKEESTNDPALSIDKKSTTTATTAIVKEDEEMKDVTNTEIKPEDVIVLQGHQSEVYSCAWNPVVTSLLASGSGDATARLWQVPDTKDKSIEPIVLNHLPNLNENKDVTSLDWNVSIVLFVVKN